MLDGQGVGQCIQPDCPETLIEREPLVCVGEPAGHQTAEVPAAVDAPLDQTRVLQDPDMLRRRRERHVEWRRQLADAEPAIGETPQHLAPAGIGEGAEYAVELFRMMFNHTV